MGKYDDPRDAVRSALRPFGAKGHVAAAAHIQRGLFE